MKKILVISITLGFSFFTALHAQSTISSINKRIDYKRPDYFKCNIEIVGQPKLGDNFTVNINYIPLVTLTNMKLVSAVTPGLKFSNNGYKYDTELLPVDSGNAYSNKINLVANGVGYSNIYVTIEGLNEKGNKIKQGFVFKLQIDSGGIEINNKPIIIPKIETISEEEKLNIIRSKAYIDTISKPINLNNETIKDSKATVTISGHWAYQDIDDGYTYKNSRYVTVKVYEDLTALPDPCLGTSYTDASGNYSVNVSFDGTKTLYVSFICETQAAYVHANIGYAAYVAETAHKSVTSTNSASWSFGNYYSAGPCWAALDDAIDEFQWIYDRTSGWTRTQVQILYPFDPLNTGPAFVSGLDYIQLPDINTWDWDRRTILHEYAHAVMYKVYGNNMPSGSGPSPHYIFSESSGGFALTEGWAEFMECAVENYVWNVYDLYNGHGGNIEDNDFYNCIDVGDMDGNIIEGSAASILWDIFDPSSTSDRDLLSLGFNGSTGSIWATINKKPADMNGFWTYWFQSYGSAHQMWSIYNHYGIEKDATPPTNPTSFTSSHTQYVWSNDRTVYESWSGATDNLSGVKGYACVWDQNSSTIPTKIITTSATNTTSPSLSDGQWYFHLITCDSATPGNWSTSTVHIAGFYIDGTAPTVTVNSPNGGESILYGSTITITWSQSDNNAVSLDSVYYSTNGGSTWTFIWGGSATTSYNWTVSATPSTQCRIKVIARDAAGNRTEDVSNNNFTIYESTPPTVTVTLPNGGENWAAGSGKTITWTQSDNISVARDSIYYSTNGGSTWSFIWGGTATTSYNWTVPSNLSTQCRVKVIATDGSGNRAEDISNNNFTISDGTPPVVTIISPNGGENWTAGTTQAITWTQSDVKSSDGSIKTVVTDSIFYSTNNGSTWSLVWGGAATTSYNWNVPNTPSVQCLVKVVAIDGAGNKSSDLSNTVFTITGSTITVAVSVPNGGESWPCGTSKTITWSQSGGSGTFSTDSVYYSTNNGSSWVSLYGGATKTSHTWNPIPNAPSTQCLVKVVAIDNLGAKGSDLSNSVFTISDTTKPTVTVITPNGGENLAVSSSYNITWSQSDNISITTDSIYYSTNSGSTWQPVWGSTATTSYSWTIPNTPSTTCLVKVIAIDASGNKQADQSNTTFTIKASSTDSTWVRETVAEIPFRRMMHSTVYDPVNDKIYLSGGYSTQSGFCNTHFQYDPNANVWTSKTVMPDYLYWHSGVYCRGKIYIIGGYNSAGSRRNTMYVYNIATNTWSTGTVLPDSMINPGFIVWRDSLIYRIGGASSSASTVQYFNAAGGGTNWVSATNLPAWWSDGGYSSYGDTIILAGGSTLNCIKGVINPAMPSNIVWDTISISMPVGGANCYNGMDILNGKIYVSGGFPGPQATDTVPSNRVWEYQRGSNSWVDLPALPTKNTRMDNLVARNGYNQFFIMGGDTLGTWSSTPYVGSASVYRYRKVPTGVEAGNNNDYVAHVSGYNLYAYPNPISISTKINFTCMNNTNLSIDIYDVVGRKIRHITNGAFNKGTYTTIWDCRDNGGQKVSTGIYFCYLKSTSGCVTYRLTVVK